MPSTSEVNAERVTEVTAQLQELLSVQIPQIQSSMLIVQQISKKDITELKAL